MSLATDDDVLAGFSAKVRRAKGEERAELARVVRPVALVRGWRTSKHCQAPVAAWFDVTPAALRGPKRHRRLADARAIAMWLARACTRDSYPAIGRAFGNRDHSTVMAAVAKVTGWLAAGEPAELVQAVQACRAAIEGHVEAETAEERTDA